MGWLEGKLKSPEPPPRDVRRERYDRLLERTKAWEAKQRRAATALHKLKRQRAYYERAMA